MGGNALELIAVANLRLETVIRLERLDQIHVFGADLLKSSLGLFQKFTRAVGDWKLNHGLVPYYAARPIHGKLKDEVVQRGTKVVHGISENDANAFKDRGVVGYPVDIQAIFISYTGPSNDNPWSPRFCSERLGRDQSERVFVFAGTFHL